MKMSKYQIGLYALSLLLILNACGASPPETAPVVNSGGAEEAEVASAETLSPQDTPTATLSPTAVPPTATPTPVPVPVAVDNVGELFLANFSDFNRKHIGDPYAGVQQIYKNSDGDWLFLPVSAGRPIKALWNADGSALLVETNRGIDVLDGTNLELLKAFDGYALVNTLSNGLMAVLQGSELFFLDLETGEAVSQWVLENATEAFGVSPDGQFLAVATDNRTFDLINLATQDVRSIVIERKFAPLKIIDFVFNADSSLLFVSHSLKIDGTLPTLQEARGSHLFSVETGEQFYEILTKIGIEFVTNEEYAYWDGSINAGRVYLARPSEDLSAEVEVARAGGKILAFDSDTCEGFTYIVSSFSFQGASNVAGLLYDTMRYGYDDACKNKEYNVLGKTLLLRDLPAEEDIGSISTLEKPYPLVVDFSPDGDFFYTIAPDGIVRLWDAVSLEVVHTSSEYLHAGSISMNADGTKLVVPSWDHFEIWDATSFEVLASVPYPDPSASSDSVTGSVHFLTDDLISVAVKYQAGASAAFTYDLKEESYIASFYAATDEDLRNCSYSANGASQVCWSGGNTTSLGMYTIYNTLDGVLHSSYRYEMIQYYALSNDGTQLAQCRADASSINIGPVDQQLRAYQYPCQDMVFLPGDTQLLLADGTVVDLETKDVAGTFAFTEPYLEFPEVFPSPNGDFIFIGTQIYDLQTGEMLGTLGTEHQILDVGFSQDGMDVVVLTEYGLAYFQARN
jgi:WD40 repeat protein